MPLGHPAWAQADHVGLAHHLQCRDGVGHDDAHPRLQPLLRQRHGHFHHLHRIQRPAAALAGYAAEEIGAAQFDVGHAGQLGQAQRPVAPGVIGPHHQRDFLMVQHLTAHPGLGLGQHGDGQIDMPGFQLLAEGIADLAEVDGQGRMTGFLQLARQHRRQQHPHREQPGDAELAPGHGGVEARVKGAVEQPQCLADGRDDGMGALGWLHAVAGAAKQLVAQQIAQAAQRMAHRRGGDAQPCRRQRHAAVAIERVDSPQLVQLQRAGVAGADTGATACAAPPRCGTKICISVGVERHSYLVEQVSFDIRMT